MDLLQARWRAFSDLRTLVDARLEHQGDKEQFTGVLLLAAPNSLRFEALAPFGQPLWLVTMHDGELTAYDVLSNAATVGPATAKTSARFLHLPVEPDDLVGVLAGYAVPPKDLRVATILPPDAQGPSLEMIGALHRQRVWMDLATGVVRAIQVTGGRVEATVKYRRGDEGRLLGLDITAAQDNVTGTMQYRDLTVGGGVDPERFRLAIPQGASVERLR